MCQETIDEECAALKMIRTLQSCSSHSDREIINDEVFSLSSLLDINPSIPSIGSSCVSYSEAEISGWFLCADQSRPATSTTSQVPT